MALFTRIIRLLKADIHGVMDRLEDQDLLLQQHLRDMQESLVQKAADLKKNGMVLQQARQDYEMGAKETHNLDKDLEAAIKKDRDDIARMLIKKLNPLARIQSERRSRIKQLNLEIEQSRENLAQQRLQYEQLRQKAAQYFHRPVKQSLQTTWSEGQPGFGIYGLSKEEVELELLKRKESIKGGALS